MTDRTKLVIDGRERLEVLPEDIRVAIGLVVRKFVPKANWTRFAADKEQLIKELVAEFQKREWEVHGPPALRDHGPIGYSDKRQGPPGRRE